MSNECHKLIELLSSLINEYKLNPSHNTIKMHTKEFFDNLGNLDGNLRPVIMHLTKLFSSNGWDGSNFTNFNNNNMIKQLSNIIVKLKSNIDVNQFDNINVVRDLYNFRDNYGNLSPELYTYYKNIFMAHIVEDLNANKYFSYIICSDDDGHKLLFNDEICRPDDKFAHMNKIINLIKSFLSKYNITFKEISLNGNASIESGLQIFVDNKKIIEAPMQITNLANVLCNYIFDKYL